jgi:hypothetical protein
MSRSVLAAFALASSAAQALEFLLPLPGEAIQTSGAALLVRADPGTGQIRFRLHGPTDLVVDAQAQEADMHSASLPDLAPGNWTLVVEAIHPDSSPTPLDSTSFRATPLEPTLVSTQVAAALAAPPAKASASGPRTQQSLYLSIDAGYRQGASEGPIESWRPLRFEDGRIVAGEREAVLDREYTGGATAIWNLQRGALQLRTKTSADLGDQPGRTQPFHRLGIDAAYGPWVDAHLGDQYPDWSPLMMDGSRIRGIGIGLAATRGGESWGRVRYVAGWSRRATDPILERNLDGTLDTSGAAYDRQIQVLHVGLGGGRNVLWGLTYVHALDDTSGADMALRDTLGMASPKENAAIGSDLQIWFWKRRVELFGHWSTSLVTDNTRLGGPSDSLGELADIEQIDLFSPAITLNSSTRGIVKLMAEDLGSEEALSFLGDNSALRTGIRLNTPVSSGRMSHELRWVHAGSSWESFARSTMLPAQTGVEFSHASNWAHDRLFLSATTGYYSLPRDASKNADRTRVSASASLSQGETAPGAYIDGGKDWTNEPQGGRVDSWNAGGGLYRSFRPTEDHVISANIGYSRSETEARSDSESTVGNHIVQNSWNGLLRWRLPAPVELRTGAQFATNETSIELVGNSATAELQTTYGSFGTSVWLFGRSLELSADGGLGFLAGDNVDEGLRQWRQNSRVLWRLPDEQSLRLSQQYTQIVDGRGDLRIDAGWEKFF